MHLPRSALVADVVDAAAMIVLFDKEPHRVHAATARAVWQAWLGQSQVNDAARVNTELTPHFCVNRISVAVLTNYNRFCYVGLRYHTQSWYYFHCHVCNCRSYC